MFYLRRVFRKVNVNNLTRSYVERSKIDPGIRFRKKILNTSEELEESDFDDLETDFMNVHQTHKEHMTELKLRKEKEKYLIVKQRYFKEKYPNFLTWHDKEQIRYLHNINPEEWTVERLSMGFPALPEVIGKIVNSKWTKKKMGNHDVMVQKNWEMFKKGQLSDLPKELVEHLNKFTSRSLTLKPYEIQDNKKVDVKVNDNKLTTEFSEIITSYEILKGNKSQKSNEHINVNVNKKSLQAGNNKDTFFAVKNKKKDKTLVTLHELQDNLESKALRGKNLPEDDKLLLTGLKASSENANVIEVKQEITDIGKTKYATSTESALIKKNEVDYSYLMYPERIMIPNSIRKKGYTYKLNDCFYDSDGQFLYRVPGMG